VVHWREEGGQSKRQVCISVLYHNEADGDKVLDQLDSGNGNGITQPSKVAQWGDSKQRYIQKSPVTIIMLRV